MSLIHPTAIVDSKATLADSVSVGPYSIIGPDVVIGEGCVIHNHATIIGNTTLGKNVHVSPGAVLGGAPQDLKYKGERTTLEVGDDTIIRECATLNIGTALGGGKTVVGKKNLIMAYVHIAHDCLLKDNIVIANGSQLAGHVHVDDGARISALVTLHHFVRLGKCSYIGSSARVSIDVPPFTLADGNPAKIKALNKEGMRRRGFSEETKLALKECFRLCFRRVDLSREQAFEQIAEQGLENLPEIKLFTDFLRATSAGKFGRALEAVREIVPLNERDGKLDFKIKAPDLSKSGA